MRSFAAIAAIATLAFSAFTSAIPTPQGLPVPNLLGTLNPSDLATQVTTYVSNINALGLEGMNLDGTQENTSGGPLPTGAGLGDVLVKLATGVVPIAEKIVAQVTVEVAVEDALEIALKLVAEILALLTDALAEVKVIVKGDISTILCLEGKVLELSVFANLLADVLVIILSVLGLVVKICSSIDISALLKLVLEITGVLAVLLGLILKVVAGLLVILTPLLQVVLSVLSALGITSLISVFGLSGLPIPI